jgi:hypothetical protein
METVLIVLATMVAALTLAIVILAFLILRVM